MELAGVGPGAEKEVEGQDEDRPRARKERHRRSLKCAGRKDSQCVLSVLSPDPFSVTSTIFLDVSSSPDLPFNSTSSKT